MMLCATVVALARQIGTLYLRIGPTGALEIDDEGPPLGDAPTPHPRIDLDGRQLNIGGPGGAQLLLFVSPGCMVCDQVLPSIRVIARANELAPFIITDADSEETRISFRERDLNAPVIAGRDITRDYAIPGTPYLVVLDELGLVRAKGTVNNLEQMQGLIDTANRRIVDGRGQRNVS
jgi:methylamine dehydrogenase accessory protein MauD